MVHRRLQFCRCPAEGVWLQTGEVVWKECDGDNVCVLILGRMVKAGVIIELTARGPSSPALGGLGGLGPRQAATEVANHTTAYA